jgi:hypothetical protein
MQGMAVEQQATWGDNAFEVVCRRAFGDLTSYVPSPELSSGVTGEVTPGIDQICPLEWACVLAGSGAACAAFHVLITVVGGPRY